ncbi:helix-turn-helix transcriptional regulator [Planococcus sp. S3-L1]|uniref:helix-turn-helix domain-containing protein n=1 Tax=Planococcus sp. S3-L1 TaxID=3046200 RepID=UPI0024BB86C5|nr:helix-turn-helix transcriptional regulator [Planococcus sp. S3-L1]MDJ0332998.1 helix-turn-helix transcriptional regulator [Planococcus sp. S3-L1]
MTSQHEHNVYEKIGSALKSIRLEKKLKLKDIEAISEMNGPTISNIERGKQNVSIGWLIHYANVLEIDPTEIFLRAFKDDFKEKQLEKIYERFNTYNPNNKSDT